MDPKIIFSYSAHGDSHPALNEGNHHHYYLSLLPVFLPLPLFTVLNAYSLRDPILSPKVLYSLLGVYQALKSTHFYKGLGELERLRGENGVEERKSIEKIKIYGKTKCKDL